MYPTTADLRDLVAAIHFSIGFITSMEVQHHYKKHMRNIKVTCLDLTNEQIEELLLNDLGNVLRKTPADKLKVIREYLYKNKMYKAYHMFYHQPVDPESINQEEATTMNYQQTNLLLSDNDNFRIIGVTFDSGDKVYHYKSFDTSIEAEQRVIVNSPSTGFTAVTVVEVLTYDEYVGKRGDGMRLKWVVSTIPTENYDKCVELEQRMQEVVTKGERRKARATVLEEMKLALPDESQVELMKLAHEASTFGTEHKPTQGE